MTWTWGEAPSTSTTNGRRDAIRSLIRDTNSSRQLLSDEEITFFYNQRKTIYGAAAVACLALADAQAVNKSIGDLSISDGMKLTNYAALAAQYERMAALRMVGVPYAGGISVSDKQTQEEDSDRTVPIFTRTIHGDPELEVGSTSSAST